MGGVISTGDTALVDEVCRLAGDVHGDVVEVVTRLVDRTSPLAGEEQRQRTITAAVARLAGLDVIESFLADPAVDEVMVNAGHQVWVDRQGQLERVADLPPDTLATVLERVLAPTGKRIDRLNPIVDVRLADGSRLCAVISPVAVDGTTVAIRTHRRRPLNLADFLDPVGEALVGEIVTSRCNVLVSGATSAGKTTFVAAVLAACDRRDRVVVCEDTTELHLPHRHVVRLESRPATPDGVSPVDLASLVRAGLRLRPDRLIVGEFRGPEVLAAVEAMNTGHDGSISTCHANGAVDALRRVETLLMQAAPAWPLAAIRRQVSRSIDVVVHLARDADGARRVVEIAEVVETSDEPEVRLLFDPSGRAGSLQRRRRAR